MIAQIGIALAGAASGMLASYAVNRVLNLHAGQIVTVGIPLAIAAGALMARIIAR